MPPAPRPRPDASPARAPSPAPSPGPAPGPLAARLRLAGEPATAALGAALAPRLRPGDALLLSGPLGAGKSALARALVRARLREPGLEVPSPTFTLVQTYGEGADAIWHADLYRLGTPAEAHELGLLDAFGTAICLVEWPEVLGPHVPAAALRVTLAPARGDEDAREATLEGPAPWGDRLGPALGALGG